MAHASTKRLLLILAPVLLAALALVLFPPTPRSTIAPHDDGRSVENDRTSSVPNLARAPIASPVTPTVSSEHGQDVVAAESTRARSIRVLDAVTRIDLDQLTLVSALFEFTSHPGTYDPASVLAADAASPISIDVQHINEAFWISAPGHAWERITPSELADEDAIVLRRAADLDASLVHLPADRRCWLRLYATSDTDRNAPTGFASPYLVQIAAAHMSLGQLLPGSYRLSVELGANSATDIGRTDIELIAGETTRVRLEVGAPRPVGDLVPLAGTLYVPLRWGVQPSELEFEILDRSDLDSEGTVSLEANKITKVADRPGLYCWNAGSLPCGRYLVKMRPFEQRETVELRSPGNSDVALTVAEPADVTVILIDGADGKEVTLDGRVIWRGRDIEGESLRVAERAEPNPVTGHFEFRAPAVQTNIHVEDARAHPGYRDASQAVQLLAGENEVVVRLERATGVLLVLRDGEITVPWTSGWMVGLVNLDGTGGGTGGFGDSHAPDALWMGVDQPGTYRATVQTTSTLCRD